MVDLSDNFSTYAVVKTTPDTTQAFNFTEDWAQQGTLAEVDTENERIIWTGTKTGDVQAVALDLGEGVVSDTAWVLRFKINIENINTPTTNDASVQISITTADVTVGNIASQDAITFSLNKGASGGFPVRFVSSFSDNESLFTNPSVFLDPVTPVQTPYYVELKRTSSTTMDCTVYTDYTYNTVKASNLGVTIDSTITGLRFIKIQGRDAVTSAGIMDGTIDNIQFWNGVTEAPTNDNFDLQESFSDDFTSYLTQPEADANWASSDVSVFKPNIIKDNLDFILPSTTSDDAIVHDLGAGNVSGTDWVLRFKLTVSSFSGNTTTTAEEMGWIISDSDDTEGGDVVQNWIGIVMQSAQQITDIYSLEGRIGANVRGSGAGNDFAHTVATETIFWEIKRTSSTTIEATIFSDANYTTVVETSGSLVISNVTGLRYLKLADRATAGNTTFTGTIDDVQFWNSTSAPDNWLKQDITKLTVNRNGKTIDFDIERNGSNDNMSLDLGSALSDSAWVMRIHNVEITDFVGASGGGTVGEMGMCDQDSTASDATPVDFLGFTLHSRISTGNQHWRTEFLDGTASNAVSGRTRFDKVPIFNIGERYWLEVARTSTTTARYRIYADAGFTTLMEELTETFPATITGLRFIWIMNTSSPVTSGDIVGTLDKIEILDGATEMITEDFEDDFSRGTDDWSDIGTGFGVDTGNQILKADASDSSVNNQTSFDLGVGGVSNDEWVLRFKYTPTVITNATNAEQSRITVGLFDVDENTNLDTAQDGIMFSHRVNGSGGGNVNAYGISDVNGIGAVQGVINNFSLTPVQDTAIFVELKRTSLTTFSASIYTDSTYTEVVETVTGLGLVSGTRDLRFIKVGNYPTHSSNDSSLSGEIDDIQFFNNVPSVPFEDNLSRIPIFTDNFNNLTFFDDFATSANWVQTGSQISITGGVISGWGANQSDQRLTHTLAEPLSDTDWVLDFEYRFTASNNPLHRPMNIVDKDQDLNTSTNDSGFTLSHNMNTFTDGLRIQWVANDGNFGNGTDIEILASTTYFVRIERINSTTITLNIYSDADRTTHITGSPTSLTDVPASLGGLKYLVTSTNTNASATRTLTGTIDNLSISDASWVSSASRNYVVNGTNNNIDFDGINVTNDTIVHDLGAGVVDSAKWRLRFKLNFSTLTTGVATNIHFGLSDSDEQEGGVGLQDFIMARLTDTTDAGGQKGYGCIDADNGAPSGTGFEQLRFFTFLTGVDYFVEIKRLSLIAYTVNVFTDSSFTTSAGGVSTGVTTAGVTGLRFIKFTGIQSGATGAMIGTVDDVEFVNGEVWGQTGEDISVNNSTEVIDFTYDGDGLDDAVSYDLGVAQSQDQWTLRTKVDLTTLTAGADGSRSIIWYGLSDSDDTVAGDASQDSIGILFGINNGDTRWFSTHSNAGSLIQNNTQKAEILVTQAYFLEITRTSPTSARYRLYSDANYSDLIEEGTEIVSSATAGLRFIKVSNSVVDGTEDSTIIGTTDDIEFYRETVAPKAVERNTTSQSFDFSDATGWVQTGSNYTVDATTDQRIEMTGADGTDQRVTFDLGTNGILSEEDWTIEFEYEFSAFNTPSMKPIAVSDDSGDMHNPGGVTDDAIVVNHRSLTFANEISSSHMNEGDAGINMTFGTAIEIFVNTRYYIRLERIRSTTVKISVFSDPDFTQHISGSPQTQTGVLVATDVLRFLHSQNSSDGSPTRTLTANVDNLKVYREKRANEFQDRWKEVDE